MTVICYLLDLPALAVQRVGSVAVLLESRAEAKGSKKRYTGEHIFV